MTDWLSATAMILSGAIVGFMFWYGMKGRAPKPDLERLDLEAKRDALLQQLRELKETGGSVDEQRRLERETADVLRRIDQRGGAPVKPTKVGEPSSADVNIVALTRAASIRGFVWGAASIAILGGIGWFVTQHATPKTEGTTGGTPMAASQSPVTQQVDTALQMLQSAVAKSPDDLEARNQLAKAYLERDNPMAVFEQTQYILQRSPNDARALTYQALVRMTMGQRDGAAEMLQRALKSDPDLIDAYVALAWDDMQRGKTSDAEGLISEAGRRHPDQKTRLADVLARMKEQVKNPAPVTPAPATASAAAPASGPSVHVTLSLAGGTPSPNAVLFIIARAAGQTAGPPAAVKRIASPTFPLEIDLSAADSMMGQPLPANMRIEARLDSDGDAMTKNPSDPHAVQDGVTSGAKVSLVLK